MALACCLLFTSPYHAAFSPSGCQNFLPGFWSALRASKGHYAAGKSASNITEGLGAEKSLSLITQPAKSSDVVFLYCHRDKRSGLTDMHWLNKTGVCLLQGHEVSGLSVCKAKNFREEVLTQQPALVFMCDLPCPRFSPLALSLIPSLSLRSHIACWYLSLCLC